MGWTGKQQKVIDSRDCSILVSAAAGSGKTAVLVERILSKVLDENEPHDISEFLVVTFTRAAAAQMKDKISQKLELELEANPFNEHLMKQLLLVNRADITTIDSFCYSIVKEHFSMLNLDSAFTIGDPGMMELIRSDVIDELFDEKYKSICDANSGLDFAKLLEIFSGDRDDEGLKNEILKLYNMASSFPQPIKWLENAKTALLIETEEELSKAPWMVEFIDMIKNRVRDALKLVQYGREICCKAGGPDKNIATAEKDEIIISAILNASDYNELRETMQIKWPRLATCKGDAYDMELVDSYKNIRESYKDIIKSVNIFKDAASDIVEELQIMRTYLVPLVDLTIEFIDAYDRKKTTRKIMEFSDVEHLAYNLVCDGYDENGTAIPSEIGKQIAGRYSEIYIDEYQDSNYLQEDILVSVSGLYKGIYNMFMVGDVKQSIYRFRMARPDLFINKYNRFNKTKDEIMVELRENFRSRAVVLETANFFFYQLMGRDLGGIDYNDNVALVPSKDFPEPDGDKECNTSTDTELMLLEYEHDDMSQEKAANKELDKLEIEAYMIANRIKQLVDKNTGLDIYDETAGGYRKATFKDIVILGRSVKDFGEAVYNALSAEGIPVYLEASNGYFDAVEIRVIMSLLSVVDNSRQDVELSAMLLSPIGGINENELALICDYATKHLEKVDCLYEKCMCYMLDNEDDISDKLKYIFHIVDELKEDKTKMSISALIWKALQITGYYSYASAMPMGEKRKANIDMLLTKADSFEDGYYKGLFNFLRYVEKLKINDVDFGEANLLSDDDDVVRIMSMHKSKGLEYPIVFVSGIGRGFNKRLYSDALILHSDYYMASTLFNTGLRYKKKSFIKEAFKLLINHENMAEELRILYVAMTRAKEKLIITGCDKELDKIEEKYQRIKESDELLLPFITRQQAKSFLELILACMVRYDKFGDKICKNEISLCKHTYEDVISLMSKGVCERAIDIDRVVGMAANVVEDELFEQYKASFDFVYPYKAYTEIKSKMSISEIKKMKAYDGTEYDVDTEFDNAEYMQEDGTEKGNHKLSGAQRGTIVHKYMELYPFGQMSAKADYKTEVNAYLQELLDRQVFDETEKEAINPNKISRMLASKLGQRMIKADRDNILYKEQQFSVGIKANKLYDSLPDTEDVVIVQGIIDAYFVEDGEIVVMDYKTDRATREELVGRYKAQLDYYAATLEQLSGLSVKEKIIYSFHLNEEVVL